MPPSVVLWHVCSECGRPPAPGFRLALCFPLALCPLLPSSGRDLLLVLQLSPLRFSPSVQFRMFFSLHRSVCSDRRLPPTKALVANNARSVLEMQNWGGPRQRDRKRNHLLNPKRVPNHQQKTGCASAGVVTLAFAFPFEGMAHWSKLNQKALPSSAPIAHRTAWQAQGEASPRPAWQFAKDQPPLRSSQTLAGVVE